MRSESRIPAAVAIVLLVALLAALPSRYVVTPHWFLYTCGTAFLLVLIAAAILKTPAAYRFQRVCIIGLVTLVALIQVFLLTRLLQDTIVHNRDIGAIALLATAIAIWVTNVMMFTFLYWEVDRGGPEGRASGFSGRADITFPRGDPSDNFPADWQPGFIDYLMFAYNTSTAFSPTDALPLTARMKLLMLAQSAISLVTILIVASRAINLLG